VTPIHRARLSVASRHLDATLSAYADRSLPAATLLTCDQHVAICPRCRAAVDTERRLLSSLRTAVTPGLSCRLEAALLDLAAHTAGIEPTGGPAPLRVVRPAAPAMHHSPVRAVMLASLVAGASAAAAWSLGVSGVGPPVGSLTVVRLPEPAATAISTDPAGQSLLVAGTRPGIPDISRGWAQSIMLRTIEP
jgi:anti-sigma factor RsiW